MRVLHALAFFFYTNNKLIAKHLEKKISQMIMKNIFYKNILEE